MLLVPGSQVCSIHYSAALRASFFIDFEHELERYVGRFRLLIYIGLNSSHRCATWYTSHIHTKASGKASYPCVTRDRKTTGKQTYLRWKLDVGWGGIHVCEEKGPIDFGESFWGSSIAEGH